MLKVSNTIEISVVIPCYRSENSICELTERLIRTLDSVSVPYEIIYVNDCSPDSTLDILRELVQTYPMIKVIDLMSNVGQFRALMCGFENSCGEYIITMDDDLQHPPEEIPKLYKYLKSRDDLDGVIAKYEVRKYSIVRNLGTRIIRKMDTKIFRQNQNLESTSFRCLNRKLINTILENKSYFPIIGPLVKKSSNRLENILVRHENRQYGNSNYSLIKLIRTTYDYVFNYSSLPLKYISIIGIMMSCISIILTAFYLVRYLYGQINVSGWTTIILLLNFYSGLVLLSISFIGEYMIRILGEVSHQPRFQIREIYNKNNSLYD